MLKTTAKVEYRDYIPWGWIAIKFCNVYFYGFRNEEMKQKWDDIKHKRYIEYNPIFERNETQIKDWRAEAKFIRDLVKKSKPFFRFWYNKNEKYLLDRAIKLERQADELEVKNEEIGNKRFYSVFECRRRIEELLKQNGFVLTHTSSIGGGCVIRTEVWTLEE